MKTIQVALAFILVSAFTLGGCEIVTNDPPVTQFRPASTIVINEVFTLPPASQAPYSWIEFINPTSNAINIGRYTLEFSTNKFQTIVTAQLDSNYQFKQVIGVETGPVQPGTYEIPFAQTLTLTSIGATVDDTFMVAPNELYTLVNNEDRMLDHVAWGPSPGEQIERPGFATLDSATVDSTYRHQDSVLVYVYQTTYTFQLQTTDRLVLRDGNHQVVDVVKYGNYVYPGPGSDPYPSSATIGAVPSYESIERYAGGYYTGNAANDFFVTGQTIRPVPGGYNQRSHLP
jgi:hypothetical protein